MIRTPATALSSAAGRAELLLGGPFWGRGTARLTFQGAESEHSRRAVYGMNWERETYV